LKDHPASVQNLAIFVTHTLLNAILLLAKKDTISKILVVILVLRHAKLAQSLILVILVSILTSLIKVLANVLILASLAILSTSFVVIAILGIS
jgi:hypothetical protein